MAVTRLLQRLFPHKQIGWAEIQEDFLRFTLLTTRWFTVYLHRLDAPLPHPQCHDHPWSFVSFLIKGGYQEHRNGHWVQRRPGSILVRKAECQHNVVTNGVSWSLVITGPRRRQWGFVDTCRD